MFYPVAVMVVAVVIMAVLMVYVIPQFKSVFSGMLEGQDLPAFTRFVLAVSDMIKDHFLWTLAGLVVFSIIFVMVGKTKVGRRVYDKVKLKMPVFGPVISKVAISRFTRTLGTLVSSGVPILQALTIVKETAGNVIVGAAVGAVHESASRKVKPSPRRWKPPTSYSRPWSSVWWTSASKLAPSRKCCSRSPITTTKRWTTPSRP